MTAVSGKPVVLTADRTLMADHRTLFGGMIAASQTTTTPRPLMDHLLAPRSRLSVAPLGLRRVEAALLCDGFSDGDVAVVEPERLAEVIGPETRVIGVSAGEACGLGMNSTTMTAIAGGEIYPRALVLELMREIGRLRERAPDARVVLGGPGAWQLVANDALRVELGVDHVVHGPVEGNVAGLMHAMAAEDDLPVLLEGGAVDAASIPAIRGASAMGAVELSRGCGLGCTYCVMGREAMRHLPEETILADVRTNIAAGMRGIAAISEDLLRYGCTGSKPHPERLIALLRQMREIPGAGLIQTDHANIISVAAYSDAELAQVRELMVGETGCRHPWMNLGVESACGQLLAQSGSAKLGGTAPAEWGEFAAEQLRRLVRAGFMPMASLIMCLPGETPEHVRATLEWVKGLSREPLTIFPVLYAPIDGSSPPTRADLTREHWRLIGACYDINFREVPRMFRDGQAAVGVPWARRMALQLLGYGQVGLWSALFAWHGWRAAQ
ncbi:MAG: hypothetical protein GX131_15725 [candidate division WS1 bacterium]|nr:hypothetical protein [candidate division WS1 bacterium]